MAIKSYWYCFKETTFATRITTSALNAPNVNQKRKTERKCWIFECSNDICDIKPKNILKQKFFFFRFSFAVFWRLSVLLLLFLLWMWAQVFEKNKIKREKRRRNHIAKIVNVRQQSLWNTFKNFTPKTSSAKKCWRKTLTHKIYGA